MLKRLKIKFIAAIMVIATAMLCLIFALVYRFTQSNLERESLDIMRSIASVPFFPEWGTQGWGGSEWTGDAPDRGRLPFLVVQFGPRGEPIAPGGYYDQEYLSALVAACQENGGQTGVLKEYGLRFCRVDTPEGKRLVFADMTSERTALSRLAKGCAAIGILCFAAFLGVSFLLAGWMVKPVARAWQQQRQFVADASHELKTPLTVIISNAEMLQLPEYDEESRACFAGRILTMSQQMRGLVERLLELARTDSGQARTAHTLLNLSELTEYAALPFEPLFFEKELELAAGLQPDIFVEGDSRQLQQVIDILLDNAQKYTPAPGRVELTLKQADRRRCVLSVSNACQPMEKEELKNLFKRFYRMDKARSRDGSFGLGLSIAESIAAGHRGRIWAEWHSGRITFFVELPVKEPHGGRQAGRSTATSSS